MKSDAGSVRSVSAIEISEKGDVRRLGFARSPATCATPIEMSRPLTPLPVEWEEDMVVQLTFSRSATNAMKSNIDWEYERSRIATGVASQMVQRSIARSG